MAKKKSKKVDRYQTVHRYFAGITTFCLLVAFTGMLNGGTRFNEITILGFTLADATTFWCAVLVGVLFGLSRILMWLWKAWEEVSDARHSRS